MFFLYIKKSFIKKSVKFKVSQSINYYEKENVTLIYVFYRNRRHEIPLISYIYLDHSYLQNETLQASFCAVSSYCKKVKGGKEKKRKKSPDYLFIFPFLFQRPLIVTGTLVPI